MNSPCDRILDERILIVDDCDDIRANLADILEDVGYRVDQAHDGPSALNLVRENSYAIALLDFKMPGMDGAMLAQEIKRLRPKTAAILITAYSSGKTAQQVVDTGVVQFLRKPVDLDRLLPMVAEAFVDQRESS